MGDAIRPLQPGETAPAFALASGQLRRNGLSRRLARSPVPDRLLSRAALPVLPASGCTACRRTAGPPRRRGRDPGRDQHAGGTRPPVFSPPADAGNASVRPGLPHASRLRRAAYRVPARWQQRAARMALSRKHGAVRGGTHQPYGRTARTDAADGRPTRYSTPRTASSSKKPINAILANHATQLVGHFLVDADGTVGWAQIEALDGPNSLCIFPTAAEIIAAAGSLRR